MTDTNTIAPGLRVSEYVLVEPLGQGSFGSVWKAKHHVWQDQLVAVKLAHDPALARSLTSEGAVIHGLHHPSIVRPIGLDPYADPPYLILEYVAGSDLRKRLNAGPLSISEAVHVFRQMLSALDFAHSRGVIHRDIKPENVLIQGRDGGRGTEIGSQKSEDRSQKSEDRSQKSEVRSQKTEDRNRPSAIGKSDAPRPMPTVKLTDFGLGLVQETPTGSILRSSVHSSPESKELAGTLAYMAPEVRDGGKADARSDLYSAGIVLFEMLTGKLPAGAEKPSDLKPDVPRWLNEIFEKCYARRERRWNSAREILNALDGSAAQADVPRWQQALESSATLLTGTVRRSQDRPAVHDRRRVLCRNCGHTCSVEDNFCTECGAQLVSAVRRCGKCGGYPSASDTYCIFCGNSLGEA